MNKIKENFLPVILGTDWNAYATASSFHMEYKIKSVLLGKKRQIYTDNIDFVEIHTFDGFDTAEVFVERLIEFAKNNLGKKLLLISCSDYYTGLITETADKIAPYYIFNYIDYYLRCKLENKIDFYKTCDEKGMPYPKTFIIDKENFEDFTLPFEFPVICKPNDSFKWLKIKFEGYKKAYKVENMEVLKNILSLAYNNGYDDSMIIQDFIPGSFDAMFVVNAYVNKNGKVIMTHAAQTALDECLPNDIGNYNALISGDYKTLDETVKSFLEKVGYRGYANFDFKFDERDNNYKAFEINLRQGRSSMYMTYAGNNFIKYLVNDMIYDINEDYHRHTDEHLWYMTAKKVLKEYCAPSLKNKVIKLLNEKKANFGLDYYSKSNIQRFLLSLRRKISTIKYYPKYMR